MQQRRARSRGQDTGVLTAAEAPLYQAPDTVWSDKQEAPVGAEIHDGEAAASIIAAAPAASATPAAAIMGYARPTAIGSSGRPSHLIA